MSIPNEVESARIPPGVATIDFKLPSFRYNASSCDIKWKSYRIILIIKNLAQIIMAGQ